MFLSLFIYFERDRDSVNGGGRGGERGKERIPSRFCVASSGPDAGVELIKP